MSKYCDRVNGCVLCESEMCDGKLKNYANTEENIEFGKVANPIERDEYVKRITDEFRLHEKESAEQSVLALSIFMKTWCMNVAETVLKDEPTFRCKVCAFREKDGHCLLKKFISGHTSGDLCYKLFGMIH